MLFSLTQIFARVFGLSESRTFLYPTVMLHVISCMGVDLSVMEPVYMFDLPKVTFGVGVSHLEN